MSFKEYFTYTSKLLNAQSDVAEVIQHMPTRGAVREYFIKDIIEKHFKGANLEILRGVVYLDNEVNEGQIDLILPYRTAINASFTPELIAYNAEDCKIILEVKTKADSADFKAFNNRAKLIKTNCLDKQPLCGMFCYKINLLKTTILERFGYEYDVVNLMYIQNDGIVIDYPFIDFVVCIDQEEFDDHTNTTQFFIRKDSSEFSTGTYDLSENFPSVEDFIKMIKGVLDN
jgi:hypothetical protein